MALPQLDDIGTAPPWLRRPRMHAMQLGGNTPSSTMPYSMDPAGVRTDPATDPNAPLAGGNIGGPIPMPKPSMPGAPNDYPNGVPPPRTPGGPNDYPYGSPPTDPATDPTAGQAGGNLGLPNYNSSSGMPMYSGTGVTPGAMPAWNAGMLASNGTSVPGSPGSAAPQDPWLALLNDLPQISTDFSGDAQRGADAAYKGATQFFDQDFNRDNSALETKLANQGFAPGSEAFTNEMEKQKRGQNAARENAGFAAQGIGFQQAGDLLQRALASRAALYGERSDNANRALGARGQDKGVESAGIGASASMSNAATAADSNRYSTDVSGNLALRRLGLDQSNSDMTNLIALINSSRGGVNMPNFGAPNPLDVTGANSVASSNANAAANRTAANNNVFAQLGGSLLGSYLRG